MLGLLVVVFGCGEKPQPTKAKIAPEDPEINKVAAEIEGADQDGVRFKLSDYRGKVVVLDFWGHW
jgi:cytochrome oxidase Cu insertion factor (SCO1/SenC/PrrC family)